MSGAFLRRRDQTIRPLRVDHYWAAVNTSNRRRLQFAGEPAGLALAALWYLGKDNVTPEIVARIEAAIGPKQSAKLRSDDMPAWMADALDVAMAMRPSTGSTSQAQ